LKNQIFSVSQERLEHAYQSAVSHLRALGTLQKTVSKYRPKSIYRAVEMYLEALGDSCDLNSAIEELRDYDDIDEWLNAQVPQTTRYSDSAIEDYALEELHEKAQVLGVKILGKGEVAVKRQELEFLKKQASNWKRHQASLNGWPF
jgi:hypothetical protein